MDSRIIDARRQYAVKAWPEIKKNIEEGYSPAYAFKMLGLNLERDRHTLRKHIENFEEQIAEMNYKKKMNRTLYKGTR